jgi:threonine aldolase
MIDLRSDTVTRPTQAMREAMMTAPVGDDVYGDDPTVNQLETLAAQITGKEAALFVCSGTMGNQLAIMSHTRPGQEMIASVHSHVIFHEQGGHARLSHLSAALVNEPHGVSAEAVRNLVRDRHDIHAPRTSLLCLENALGDGTVVPLEKIRESANAAHELGLKVHMDGARLFNAATALGVPASEVAKEVDSVMFCLSKGLCAPVGSMLCGTKEFVALARRNRKVLGGGMRQAGVLAACGLLAINDMTTRLEEDHRNAKMLAALLADIQGIKVELDSVHINMVFFEVVKPDFNHQGFVEYLRKKDVLINGLSEGQYRFVTHHDVSQDQLITAAGLVREFLTV